MKPKSFTALGAGAAIILAAALGLAEPYSDDCEAARADVRLKQEDAVTCASHATRPHECDGAKQAYSEMADASATICNLPFEPDKAFADAAEDDTPLSRVPSLGSSVLEGAPGDAGLQADAPTTSAQGDAGVLADPTAPSCPALAQRAARQIVRSVRCFRSHARYYTMQCDTRQLRAEEAKRDLRLACGGTQTRFAIACSALGLPRDAEQARVELNAMCLPIGAGIGSHETAPSTVDAKSSDPSNASPAEQKVVR